MDYVLNYKTQYKIVSSMNPNMVLDCKQDKKVCLYTWHSGLNQRWKLYHLQGNIYQIQNVQYVTFLSVPNNSNQKGVQLECSNHLNSQYTYFTLVECKTYLPYTKAYHIKAAGGKNIDINGGNAWNGENIIQWQAHGDANQIFHFLPASFSIQPNCQYKIVSALDQQMCLDLSFSPQTLHSLILFKFQNSANQKFEIFAKSGQFMIRDCKSHLTLQVKDGKTNNCSSIVGGHNNKQSHQFWDFIPCIDKDYIGRNAFYIRSHCKKVLDVKGGNAKNQCPIILYDCNGNKNQIWIIKKA